MNKVCLIVLLMALMASPVFAAQTQRTIVNGVTINRATPETEGTINVSDAEKIAFFVTYNSSSTTTGVTATVTASASVDGVNWQDISWFDVAGGVTPQTSEALDTNGTSYIGWFDKALTAPYIRIGLDITEAGDATIYGPVETATITVTVVEKK